MILGFWGFFVFFFILLSLEFLCMVWDGFWPTFLLHSLLGLFVGHFFLKETGEIWRKEDPKEAVESHNNKRCNYPCELSQNKRHFSLFAIFLCNYIPRKHHFIFAIFNLSLITLLWKGKFIFVRELVDVVLIKCCTKQVYLALILGWLLE